MAEYRYDPREIEPRWQRAVDAGGHLGGLQRARRPIEVLRAGDAALPQRRAPHRPPEDLLGRRRDRPLPPAHRPPRAAPDGLRRVRAAGREPCDQDRRASARVDRQVDRVLPAPVPRVGHLDRLDPRVRHPRAALLPLDTVDLPPAARARPGLPQGGRGQVVPARPDRAGQRAGDRRPLRALRPRGRGPPARAVVLPHHRLRRPAARRPRHDRLARARQDDAAQLDRALGGRRGRSSAAGAGHRLRGLHDPTRHAVRRDLLRAGPRASRRSSPGRGHRARAGGPRVRQPRADGVRRGARRRRQGEDRGAPRPHRGQPRQRRGDPDVRGRLRADGVRHGGRHGRPRARSARL